MKGRNALALCLGAAWLAATAPLTATVTVLPTDGHFISSPTTLITFEDIPVPPAMTIQHNRYQNLGVHLSGGTSNDCLIPGCNLLGTSTVTAYNGTVGATGCPVPPCSVPPYSGNAGIGDSITDPPPGGCVIVRFVQPGTTTPTLVLEAGVWAHRGLEDDCIEFLDANQAVLYTFTVTSNSWQWYGIRATEGIRYIRFTGQPSYPPYGGGGGYLIDNLKFGGEPVVNQPPVITQGETASLSVHCNTNCPLTANQITLNATDPDGNPAELSWSIQTNPVRGTVSPTTGTGAAFTTCYDPNDAQIQPDSFVVKVADPQGGFDTITVNVTVTNDAPMITQGETLPLTVVKDSICGCPTCPDTENAVTLSATDTETPGSGLQWTVSTPPTKGSVCFWPAVQSGSSVGIRYQPNPGQTGLDSYVVRVADNCGGQDTITVAVTISSVACVTGDKADMNDDDLVNGLDIGLFVSTILDPGSATVYARCRADVGSAGDPCEPDGQADVNDIAGFILALLGQSCNQPPAIVESGPISLAVAANSNCPIPANTLTLNATDPDHSAAQLTWSIPTPPGHGQVLPATQSGGSFTFCYDPTDGYTGGDSFVVKVEDPAAASDVRLVNVTITNQPPEIAQGASTSLSVAVNSNCPSAANEITLNATDPDGDPASLAWSIQTPPSHGTVTPNSGGGGDFTFCYDPNDGQNAPDSLVVRVQDPLGAADSITVNVTLTNTPPEITEGGSIGLQVQKNSDCPNGANEVTVHATDVDGPAAALSWSIQTPPTRGTLTPTGGTGGSFTVCYDPNNGQANPDSFVLRVSDPFGGTDSITVNVTVQDLPPQILNPDPESMILGLNSFCGFAENELELSATDEEPAGLTWSILVPPATGFASFPYGSSGPAVTVCYEPDFDQNQPDSFVVRVTDPGGKTDDITVHVTVVNISPIITNDMNGQLFLQVARNSTCPNLNNQLTITATDPDAESSSLTWSIQTPPTTGVTTFIGSHVGSSVVVCYQPNPNQTAADSFVVRVEDCCGGFDTTTVLITVTP